MKLYSYKVMEDVNLNDDLLKGVKHSIMKDTMKLYSRMKKKSKTHRSVIDMNMADIREIQGMDQGRSLGSGVAEVTSVKKEMIGVLLKKMESI